MSPAPFSNAAAIAPVKSAKDVARLSARSNIAVAAVWASPDHDRESGMVRMLVLSVVTAPWISFPAALTSWAVPLSASGFQDSSRERVGNMSEDALETVGQVAVGHLVGVAGAADRFAHRIDLSRDLIGHRFDVPAHK